ncbi:hypothetical protein CVT25_004730 [Psilocybe cyanescens]|uniref:Uncharacterized protein n=1 Tax=Psilocybe cyanescens TaxID=93625 RepID=A0A409XVT6_PSICY|nr:hypothetical protein CVT25_004730 [Psilocybe cyanescens]
MSETDISAPKVLNLKMDELNAEIPNVKNFPAACDAAGPVMYLPPLLHPLHSTVPSPATSCAAGCSSSLLSLNLMVPSPAASRAAGPSSSLPFPAACDAAGPVPFLLPLLHSTVPSPAAMHAAGPLLFLLLPPPPPALDWLLLTGALPVAPPPVAALPPGAPAPALTLCPTLPHPPHAPHRLPPNPPKPLNLPILLSSPSVSISILFSLSLPPSPAPLAFVNKSDAGHTEWLKIFTVMMSVSWLRKCTFFGACPWGCENAVDVANVSDEEREGESGDNMDAGMSEKSEEMDKVSDGGASGECGMPSMEFNSEVSVDTGKEAPWCPLCTSHYSGRMRGHPGKHSQNSTSMPSL